MLGSDRQRERERPAEAKGAFPHNALGVHRVTVEALKECGDRDSNFHARESCAEDGPIVNASTMSTSPESGSPDSNLSATFRTSDSYPAVCFTAKAAVLEIARC